LISLLSKRPKKFYISIEILASDLEDKFCDRENSMSSIFSIEKKIPNVWMFPKLVLNLEVYKFLRMYIFSHIALYWNI